MTSLSDPRPASRWLHAWALLTAVVSAAAVVMGAVVTTFRVGMADPVWPTVPWHLMVISWDEPSTGYLIEHGHRLAAYGAGFCVVVLAIWLWLRGSRGLGIAAFCCVVGQGVLGGVRVLFNAKAGPELAAIHGCFAQLVFSLLVGLTVWTAPGRVSDLPSVDYARRCRRTALGLVALVFVQLIWGAFVRHSHDAAAQRMHILTAFVVVAAVIWLLKTAMEHASGRRLFRLPLIVLAILLIVQINLGIEAWMGLYTSDLPADLQPVTIGQAIVRTSHVVVGACILATASVAAIQAHRAGVLATVDLQRLEGVAPPAPATSFRPATASLVVTTSHEVKGTA
jgi:heme A synthase